ncbi:hypothetical protein BOV_A0508 [Brucella ovis ATCC 25840]|uniref:Uncharacterized protein n=1 Tax=Brucella ovis (strain ATCC 25840 / 63/290 / NCTC 10512) TaxID=444178 RepID=A0A0H3AU32_BRUO2|nr:hypothetical protein BOV_A0508 [Brucella ovis ATCC 25840]
MQAGADASPRHRVMLTPLFRVPDVASDVVSSTFMLVRSF